MQIIAEKTKYHDYAFEFPFSYQVLEVCRRIKNAYGWQDFTFFEGKWRFKRPHIAVYLMYHYPNIQVMDENLLREMGLVKQKMHSDALTTAESNAIKSKVQSSLEIKNLKLPLYEYQKIAVEFFLNNNGRIILASDIGTGKTAMSLAYIAHEHKVPALVICPASVKYSWEREVEKWTNLSSFVIDSKTPVSEIPNAQIYIINYDILGKFIDFLKAQNFSAVFIDESHMIKSATAQRSKFVKEICKNVPSVSLLSGTPLLNRPIDLFNQLTIIDPYKWHNWMSFVYTYCGAKKTYFGLDTSGATNIEDLKAQISKYFIRFKKEDVLKDLPSKVFIDVPIKLQNGYRKSYDAAMNSLVTYLLREKNKSVEQAEKSLRAEQVVLLNELRQITTACKAEAAVEIIENIIESGEKVIVFSMFNKPLKDLYEKFQKESVIVIGETPTDERQTAIDSFQNRDATKIFLGGVKAAGAGITLTAASNVLFIDQPWTAADYAQAYGRAERIGNKANCIKIHQMLAIGTIDEKIKTLIESKKKIFDQLFNDGQIPTESGDVTNDLLKELKEENI